MAAVISVAKEEVADIGCLVHFSSVDNDKSSAYFTNKTYEKMILRRGEWLGLENCSLDAIGVAKQN